MQEGLASKLDIQAIYELVGDKLRELFDSQGISILSLDPSKDLRRYHYMFEKGQRFEIPDSPISPLAQHLIQSEKCVAALNLAGSVQAGIGYRASASSAWAWWPKTDAPRPPLSSVIVVSERAAMPAAAMKKK